MSRHTRGFLVVVFILVTAVSLLLPPQIFSQTLTDLVPGTGVLLDQGSGATSSVSSNTDIFSPGTYVDYKRPGGEPTVVVDRYPFPGTNASPAAQCAAGTTICFKDLTLRLRPPGLRLPTVQLFLEIERFRAVVSHTAPHNCVRREFWSWRRRRTATRP
jgi:hypothetical protein